MGWTFGRVTVLLPVVVGLGLAAIAGRTFWFVSTMSVHPDPAAVPSAAGASAAAYATAVDASRRVARETLLRENLPGLSVAVGSHGDIVWAEGFGWADLDWRLPVTPETRFPIGTASTVLTSAAVGLLVEREQLRLDEPMQSLVPEWPAKVWPVTLRQVMAHVAGIRTDGGDEGPLFSQRCARPVEALPHFAARDLLFEPGTEFRASRYGWILVSAAVEAAAREPFLTVMRRDVFHPLGMHDTDAAPSAEEDRDDAGESVDDAPVVTFFGDVLLEPLGLGRPKVRAGMPDMTTSYFPRFGADPRYGQHEMRPLDLSCYAGAMVFVSTPSDLVRFGMAMRSGQLLQPATVRLLQTSHTLASGAETGYGLGWTLGTAMLSGQPTQTVGHDGDLLGGMMATLLTLPDHGITVAVTSNISYADTSALATRIAELFAGEAR
jgi:CubicO group peptidase (beta-lactamase class C family)